MTLRSTNSNKNVPLCFPWHSNEQKLINRLQIKEASNVLEKRQMRFKELRRWECFSGWCWSLGKGMCLCMVSKPVCMGSSHSRWRKMWQCWKTRVMIGTLKEKQMSPQKKDFRVSCLLTSSGLFNWVSKSVTQGNYLGFTVSRERKSSGKRQRALVCTRTANKQNRNRKQLWKYFADCTAWPRLSLIYAFIRWNFNLRL